MMPEAPGPSNPGGLAEVDRPFPYVTTRRLREQRWLLDAVIRQVGVDWDQGRTRYTAAAAGPDAEPDFQRVRERVRSFADIHREFAAAAERRERLAADAEAEGRSVEAREHAITAAILWGNAQWPLFGNSPLALACGERKVACFERFVRHAPHRIRRVEIAYAGSSLPGWLHLPNAGSPPYPLFIQLSGMDSFKEHQVAMYGDRFLERGIAKLAIELPGQGEALDRGLLVTETSAREAGAAIIAWARADAAIDPARIALGGNSFGSYWATEIAATVPGLAGCAVSAVIHEPGLDAIFETASPTFKARFMAMAGYTDEAAFDAFAARFDLRPLIGGMDCPYLVVAGENDELSPLHRTLELLRDVRGPVDLVVYRGEPHSIGGGAASRFGPNRAHVVAGWVEDRLAGRSGRDRWRVVDTAGGVSERDPAWRS